MENLESLIRIQLCVQQRINTREKFLKINQIDCVHKDVKSKCFLFIGNFSNNKSIPRDRGLINIIYRNILAFILRSDHHLKVYKKKKSIYHSLSYKRLIYLSIRDRIRHNLSFVFIYTIHVFLVDTRRIFILFYSRY